MFEKHLFNYIKKKNENKNIFLVKSFSSSKKEKKNNIIYGESKINEKKILKKYHQRNILFNNKITNNNPNSTSTSLSSSAEKKYLTPTKTKRDFSNGNDYYFESFNDKQNLFNNVNISMPKIDYTNKYKQNKSLHLTLGTGINRNNNNNYFSGNDYGNSKELIVNRSFKFQKNKLVLCKKVDISNNNSTINDDEQNLSSKSEEKFKINKSLNNTIDKLGNNKISFNENDYNKINNKYSIFPEKIFLEKNEEKEENENNNGANYNNIIKEKKYKNIVLRPHKIQKENQLKYNIKVNKYKEKESPDLIKKIIPKFNIKPKYSRVFKYK